jgi:hypothetical protein
MSLGNVQRPTGGLAFDFTVATNAITVATVTAGGFGYAIGDTITPADISSEAVVDTGVLPTDFVLTVATVGDAMTGDIATFTITGGGTDGTDGDGTANVDLGSESGVSDNTDYFDHTTYEQGGQIDEYKKGNGLIVTVAQTAGAIDTLTVVVAGTNYRVGDRVEISNNTNQGNNGVGGIGVVATVTDEAVGDVATLTVEAAGTGYADGDQNTAFLSRVLNQTATGEYAGSNADNDPTVSVGRLPDGQQWMVQKRYIDGGTIEVFAEPTTVNSVGDIVGNTIRAEDITDEYRCVAVFLSDGVTPAFVWDTSATGDAAQAGYGFCRCKTAAELAGDALVDADCPAGYVHSGGNCVVRAFGDVNTDEGADTINAKLAAEQCLAGGNYYEPNAAKGSRCIEGVADNFSLANFSFTTTSSAQDYAATVCQQMGFDWEGAPSYTCVDPVDVTTLLTQDTCAAAGHVWVAGTCYNKADFGDGYSRQGNEGNTDPDKLPK